ETSRRGDAENPMSDGALRAPASGQQVFLAGSAERGCRTRRLHAGVASSSGRPASPPRRSVHPRSGSPAGRGRNESLVSPGPAVVLSAVSLFGVSSWRGQELGGLAKGLKVFRVFRLERPQALLHRPDIQA